MSVLTVVDYESEVIIFFMELLVFISINILIYFLN